jgi:hypothetical protein
VTARFAGVELGSLAFALLRQRFVGRGPLEGLLGRLSTVRI